MATDSPSIKFLYPDWQHEYAAALSETNPKRLAARVEAAETAIYKRLQQISQGSDHDIERQVIQDALQGLRTLKKSELGFPDLQREIGRKTGIC